MKETLRKIGRGIGRLLRLVPWKNLIILLVGSFACYLLALLAQFRVPFGITVRPQYAVLGFFAVVWGPVMGFLVALCSELLFATAGGGLWWSIVAAACFYGFFMGFLCHRRYVREGGFFGAGAASFILASLFSHLIAWVVVCPALDMLLYRETLGNLIQRGLLDAASNTLTSWVLGTLLLALLGNIVPGRPKRPSPRDGYTEGGGWPDDDPYLPRPGQPANLFDEYDPYGP